MLKFSIFLSILLLFRASCGELLTRFSDSESHPCERLGEGQKWIQNPRGCAIYYYCEQFPEFIGNGECPDGYHFSEDQQACLPIGEIECEIDDILWGATCDGNNALKVPHPHSCSEFTVCIEDLQADFQCPDGKHFSPYDQDCVDPATAHCKVDSVTCGSSISYIPSFIASSRQCNVYYVCFNNFLTRYQCGPDQIFDPETTFCLPEDQTTCDIENPLPDLTDIPSQLSIDCTLHPNNSRIPHPESCKFWFWCSNDRSQLFWCGEGASFDTVSRTCTVTERATCVNQETEVEIPEVPEIPEGPEIVQDDNKILILDTFPMPPIHSNFRN